MTSFFSAIQNWFGGDYYGRHLGLILQEIGMRHPKALSSFIAEACELPLQDFKNARFKAEWAFPGKTGSRRRADLAVFLEDDAPSILIEIKYYDKPIPKTETKAAQLEDYRAWQKSRRETKYRRVLLLSRELYTDDDISVRRWSALARHLREYHRQSDLIDMLVQYLEEEGNAMQDIHGSALTKYMKRYLCHRKMGANNLDGPVEFSNLLKNMQLMSGNFHNQFKDSWKAAGIKLEGEAYDKRSKVASIDFDVWNRVNERPGRPVLDEYGGLRSELKAGGEVWVYARHSMGHAKDWLRISYGIIFDVSPDDSDRKPPVTYLFAAIYGAALERGDVQIEERKKINYQLVTRDADLKSDIVEAHLRSLILVVIDELKECKLPLVPQQVKGLANLRKSISSDSKPYLNAA